MTKPTKHLSLLSYQTRIHKQKNPHAHPLTDILSLHSQEHSVGQFPVLDEVIEVIQMFQFLSPSVVATNGVKETMFGNNGNQLLYEQEQQAARDSCKEKIVEDE